MTVTYSPRELLVFSHLKGTVLPEVWRMCAFTCALAYALCHIYNPIRRTVRDGGPKTIVYYIFHDCDAFFGLCTSFVTFILSFFLFGIEEVGIQIEEPFSILPLEAFCNGAIEATNKEMLGAVQKGVFEREVEH